MWSYRSKWEFGLMKRRVCIAVLVMGFSGLVAEILLLRELLIVFSGNELSIGIILANWLMLEALGSLFLGRLVETSEHEFEVFTVITFFFSLALLVAVLFTRNLKNAIGVSIGESIGLLPMFYTSLLILLPVSLLHGALFTLSCRIYDAVAGSEASSAGRVYVYETVGTMVGGVVSTYFLVPYLAAIHVAIGIALLNLIVGLVLLIPCWTIGPVQKTILGIVSVSIFLSGYFLFASHANELHHRSVAGQWKNQNVVHYQNSQYGNIAIVENQGQYIFFLDGLPAIITPIPDIQPTEEFVHLPLLSHPEPARILILSGGAGGVINESLKHPSIEAVEYAELDPLLLSLLREFHTPLTEFELSDERVSIKHTDGRLLLKTIPHRYDVIFVGIMEPSSLQANRFFTEEFFSLAAERLNDGGILVLGAPGSLALLNEPLRDLNSCIFHTLKSVFPHIRVIPGDGRHIFLASDARDITMIDTGQLVARLRDRDITAELMVPWHIESKLHPGWQDWFSDFIENGTQKTNHDFRPLGLFFSLSHWNALHAPEFGLLYRQFERLNLGIIVLLLILLLIAYVLLRSMNSRCLPSGIPLSIFTTGFAGMIFSLTVIFTFQAVYGYVFSWIGLLVASFMVGAACGAMLTTGELKRIRSGLGLFMKIDLAVACFSLGLPIVVSVVNASVGDQRAFALFRLLFLVLSSICGLLVGSQFPLANKLYLSKNANLSRTAGLLYASDLLGGWLGGIVGGVVLLPVLGVAGTCISVGLLKLAGLIVILTQPNDLPPKKWTSQ